MIGPIVLVAAVAVVVVGGPALIAVRHRRRVAEWRRWAEQPVERRFLVGFDLAAPDRPPVVVERYGDGTVRIVDPAVVGVPDGT